MRRSSNMKKNGGHSSAVMALASSRPPPAPSRIPKLQYCVRSPWEWVMAEVIARNNNNNNNASSSSSIVASTKEVVKVDTPKQLESSTILLKHLEATPQSSARRRRRLSTSSIPTVSTLRMELLDNHSHLVPPALYGTSKAFDGLEDKDELVRTFQRCRCDDLNLCPPSLLIKWDVTREECKKIIKTLPVLENNENDNNAHQQQQQQQQPFAVLKEPMGTRGEGIFFVQSLDEIYDVVERHRRQALDEGPDFLDSVMARKGRIPSWVIQAEVHPCRLLKSRKFHIRTYVAGIEKLGHDDLFDVQVFREHEVILATQPMTKTTTAAVDDDDEEHQQQQQQQQRRRSAHITSTTTTRRLQEEEEEQKQQRLQLLHDIPELRDIQPSLEVFCANVFHSVWPDLVRRVSCSRQDTPFPSIRKFTLAACDIMMTADNGRFYLLEVNVNPGAPPKEQLHTTFQRHLTGMLQELIQLLIQGKSSQFCSIFELLAKQQEQERPQERRRRSSVKNGRHSLQ